MHNRIEGTLHTNLILDTFSCLYVQQYYPSYGYANIKLFYGSVKVTGRLKFILKFIFSCDRLPLSIVNNTSCLLPPQSIPISQANLGEECHSVYDYIAAPSNPQESYSEGIIIYNSKVTVMLSTITTDFKLINVQWLFSLLCYKLELRK